jgi:hypothetical protein
MFGSSHCLHWAAVFEQVAAKEGTAVAFCCQGGNPGKFTNAHTKALVMKAARIPSVKTIVWADFWGWDGNDFPAPGVEECPFCGHDFRMELGPLTGIADDKRVILFGDVPTLSWGVRGTSINNYMYRASKGSGSLGFMNTQEDNPQVRKRRLQIEAELRRIAEDQTIPWAAGQVEYVEVASYFEKAVQVGGETKQYLQIVDPITGRLTHWNDHLNLDGALRLEPIIRQRVFSSGLC